MSKTEPHLTAAKIHKRDAAWRSELTAGHVLRDLATDRPGASIFNHEKRVGRVADVFTSEAAFAPGTDRPSLDKPATAQADCEHQGPSLFLRRIEVRSARCDGHLDLAFPAGPRATTGLRYCFNGAALKFKPEDG